MAQELFVQGRIVFGHPSKGREKKDIRTRAPIIKDGQKVMQYVFGVAIDKNTFGQQVWPVLYNEARAAFPNGIPSNFSYKFKDGDTVDSKGQPYAKREGYAGHCVLTISTEGFAPQVFKHVNGVWQQLNPEEIKCGDFVGVKTTIKYNGAVSPNTPGLYINPNGIMHIGYGQEIASGGQDPDEMFAGVQTQQFAGMSATPVMSNAPMPTAMQPAQPMGYPPLAAPAQPGYAPAAPVAAPAGYPSAAAPAAPLPAPAHDFVHAATGGAHPMPAAAPAYAPAAPASAPAYSPVAPAQPGGYPPVPGYPAGR